MCEIEKHKFFKICNSKLETIRYVKTKMESSRRITITRVVSIYINKQKNIEKVNKEI